MAATTERIVWYLKMPITSFLEPDEHLKQSSFILQHSENKNLNWLMIQFLCYIYLFKTVTAKTKYKESTT